jgi:hypothetical protein
MHKTSFMQGLAIGTFTALCLSGAGAEAADVNTADFVAACSADVSVAEDPGFDDGKVTPKAYCECVAGQLVSNKLSQKDVEMLTKMHKEEITDEDVENYPTLEDLMNANESYEDACREKLGLPVASGTDMEEEEMEGEGMPEEGEVPADDDGSPPEDDGSPPE